MGTPLAGSLSFPVHPPVSRGSWRLLSLVGSLKLPCSLAPTTLNGGVAMFKVDPVCPMPLDGAGHLYQLGLS